MSNGCGLCPKCRKYVNTNRSEVIREDKKIITDTCEECGTTIKISEEDIIKGNNHE